MVSYAHQVRVLTDEFKESLSKEEPLTGHIHIVTPDSICDDMINSHYMDFHTKYPAISIRFSTGDSTVMLDMLDHNEADMIITLDQRLYHKDYIIAKEEAVSTHFVAAADSPFANIRGLSVKELINEPFILTEYGQGYRRVFDRELAKQSLEITPVLEIGRTDIITAMIAESNMISFLPDFVTHEWVENGTLCYLDVTDLHIDIWKQLIYHKNKWLSAAMKAFLEYVKALEFSQ